MVLSTSEGSGDRGDNHLRAVPEINCDVSRSERSILDPFGLHYSKDATWSIRSDPIEPCTDDEINCIWRVGGAPAAEFQPNKADVNKLVQKLKMFNMVVLPNKFACC